MNTPILRRSLLAGIVACTAASLPVLAQTTGSVFEPETTALVMEAPIDLANIKVPASTPLPPSLTGVVSSGLFQFRSRIDNFDPIARTARVTLFLAGATTAVPTDPASLPAVTDLTMVSQSIVRFETILQSKGTWTGAGHFVTFLGGQLTVPAGTIFMTSFGYSYADITAAGTSSAGFAELAFVIPGAFNLYAANPAGTITMTAPATVTAGIVSPDGSKVSSRTR